MADPTSKYVPIDHRLDDKQWEVLPTVIKDKQEKLNSLGRSMDDLSLSLWLMEQIAYLKDLLNYNVENYKRVLD